jgi:hypothetical protein
MRVEWESGLGEWKDDSGMREWNGIVEWEGGRMRVEG